MIHQLATLCLSSTTTIQHPPDMRQKNACHILPHLPQTQMTVQHPESLLRQGQMLSLHYKENLSLLKRQTHIIRNLPM